MILLGLMVKSGKAIARMSEAPDVKVAEEQESVLFADRGKALVAAACDTRKLWVFSTKTVLTDGNDIAGFDLWVLAKSEHAAKLALAEGLFEIRALSKSDVQAAMADELREMMKARQSENDPVVVDSPLDSDSGL